MASETFASRLGSDRPEEAIPMDEKPWTETEALLEADGDSRVVDLHVWRVGPRHFAVIAAIDTATPRPPNHYKQLLAGRHDLVHVTVEVTPKASGT